MAFKLTRTLPDGTIVDHAKTFETKRAAVRALAAHMRNTHLADHHNVSVFTTKILAGDTGRTYTYPTGDGFTITEQYD